MDIISSSICKAMATQGVKLLFGSIVSNIEKKNQNKSIEEKMWSDCERKMSTHLKFASNWGRHLKVLGMFSAEKLPNKTIDLRYDAIPRSYESCVDRPDGSILTEQSILEIPKNLIILGEPGSGKTTTLQRIVTRILDGDVDENFQYQYPIVIPLRSIGFEAEISSPIISYIADELGFSPYVTVGNTNKSTLIEVGEKDNKKLLRDFVCTFLDETKAILLIDGLDEVDEKIRDHVYKEIDYLSSRLSSSKLIMTCRTGELQRSFTFFDTLNICPLNTSEVKKIARKWLQNKTTSFLDDLNQKTYVELCTRPIFLFYLIRLSRGGNALPELACYVYQDIVDLAIRDWDQERDIKRSSSYANFESGRKRSFLGRFAYELTYKIKANSFSLKEFSEIYEKICEPFGLPIEDVALVAAEIESHTGIISDLGRGEYEFSHLTIQEYLCAEHISKSLIDINGYSKYLKSRPSPLAICVALSSTPSALFCTLLMHEALYNQTNIKNVNIFLHRIAVEKPQFEVDANLGIAILYLLGQKKLSQDKELDKNIMDLFNIKDTVHKSIEHSLFLYRLDEGKWKAGVCRLYLNRVFESEYGIVAPSELYLEKEDLRYILNRTMMTEEFLFENSLY
ncbi:NACHT domain-containing protein [Alteromonas macleodii]|uniref:NACHT domain-containing protein n=1 Tax=Alteromonas macleodii TaxID=28108 RepID=UPI003BF8710E